MSDIERAARACRRSGATPGTQSEFAQDCFNDGVEAMRSALAHAARKEGGPPPWHAPCVLCGHRQSAHNTDTGPCSKCGCDCAAFRPTPPPATGEAGTREAEIRADERERCAKWHDERAETSGNERAAWWHKACAAAIRALPEAREGGRSVP